MKNSYQFFIQQTAKTVFALAVLLVLGISVAYSQTTRYVTPVGAGTMDGSSWTNSSSDFPAIINASASGDAVWVAAGIYKPTKDPLNNASPTNPRDRTFYVKDGVQIYGGFAGNETLLTQRNIAANITTLSGDFNDDDVVTGTGATLSFTNNTENAYHVVAALAPQIGGIGVTIDGFTIIGGNANNFTAITVNGSYMPRGYGGGILTLYGTNTIRNNTLIANLSNAGGGMALLASTSICTNNTIINNAGSGIHTQDGLHTFTNNTVAGNTKSGMSITYCTSIITNNTIYNNVAASSGAKPANPNNKQSNNAQFSTGTTAGGGIFLFYSNNTITNNVLYNNSADLGGAIYANDGPNTIINNTFYANSATNGGGIFTQVGTNTLSNNIFWGNLKGSSTTIAGADIANSATAPATNNITYCLTQQNSIYSTGTGIINNQNPLFVNAAGIDGADNTHRTADDGLCLSCGSPAYNVGTAIGAPTTDIVNTTRPQFGTIDMGAYEKVDNCCGAKVGTWIN